MWTIVAWYLVGLLSWIVGVRHYVKMMTVGMMVMGLVVASAGPLLFLVLCLLFLLDWVEESAFARRKLF